MTCKLERLEIRNFRSLKKLSIQTNKINVLFGPNGAGKSSFLDTIWFIRDCAVRGVDLASSDRDHGIGLLWEGRDKASNILIKLETEKSIHEILFGYSAGRIEPFAGETFFSKTLGINLIERKTGTSHAYFYNNQLNRPELTDIREPEKLALSRYSARYENQCESYEADQLLRLVRFYHSRNINLYRIKRFGSESGFQSHLGEQGENLWSVLRILKDKREIDERYDTVIKY